MVTMDDRDRFRQGRQLRRAVLGDAHVDRAESVDTSLNRALQDLTTRYGWGEVWSRPGLDRRARSLMTLGMLIALNRGEELRVHLLGALNNGVSRDEIGEAILHSALYCGLPAAHGAAHIAEEVFRALDDRGSAPA